jgi:dipeptide/tripeptide permease
VKDEEKEKPKDGESGDVKYPYPKAVFFIISTEFCERFSFYGMKSKIDRSS